MRSMSKTAQRPLLTLYALTKVEVEFHSDDDISNDNWDFCPDGTFTE